ncbi:MAG: hypothetical protein ACRDJE_12480 [Dehalococcoidia bacterium]
MGFLNKLFGRGDRADHAQTATIEQETGSTTTCLHTSLTPSWDSVADMGQEDKVTGYACQACGQTFTPAEGRALRHSEANRVQSELKVSE